jgi:hypothetical protein
VAVQEVFGDASWSSQVSYPPPTIITGLSGLVEKPFTKATDGVDQVWPICSKPGVQLDVSVSVESAQPAFHIMAGVVGEVTLNA